MPCSDLSRRTAILSDHIHDFQPDWVLVSSEDLSHVLLREASNTAADRLVYLAHTPQWYPFGPASWHPDAQATRSFGKLQGWSPSVTPWRPISSSHCGARPTVIHPPMYGEPPYPRFGSFDDGYVLMVNPCVVKGISIFLALAERFPDTLVCRSYRLGNHPQGSRSDGGVAECHDPRERSEHR